MRTRTRLPLAAAVVVAALVAPPRRAAAQPSAADSAAVTRAALDYLEGFYEGDTAKVVRAFSPQVSKYGFWRDSTGKYAGERMTFDEAIAYAKKVAARHRPVPAAWPKRVDVLDVGETIAAAKVTAWWGFDYLLLRKSDGAWTISDVLWEGPPRKRP